jgi:hypothetical protein
MCDQLHKMGAIYADGKDAVATTLPTLNKFYLNFAALPANIKYFGSKLYKLPCNNISAKFLSSPTGTFAAGVGTPITWDDTQVFE